MKEKYKIINDFPEDSVIENGDPAAPRNVPVPYLNVTRLGDVWDTGAVTQFEKDFTELMCEDRPLWIGRVGGCEYDFVKKCLGGKTEGNERHIRLFAGYFDFENKKENIRRAVDVYQESCKSTDITMVGNAGFVAKIRRGYHEGGGLDELDEQIICKDGEQKTLVSSGFVEAFDPFVRSFQTWGDGKKVLVVSPFAESINYQTDPSRVGKLHNSMSLHNCEFVTYNTPISCNEGGKHFFDSRGTNNWHEMCELMIGEIENIEFDIALLSCAMYSMYLGEKIKNKLNKKAIYLGGMLNPMFNIYGNRYDDPYFDAVNNLKYRIEAIEYKKIRVAQEAMSQALAQYPCESYNAYFGSWESRQ